MSLSAIVRDVVYLPVGTVRLDLAPVADAPTPNTPCLMVTNPVPHMDVLIGMTLHLNQNCVMVGGVRWAERETSTYIRLNRCRKCGKPTPYRASHCHECTREWSGFWR